MSSIEKYKDRICCVWM